MEYNKHIISDKSILNGKPIIAGTRISAEFLLKRLADGWNEEMILNNFPSLTKENIEAVKEWGTKKINK